METTNLELYLAYLSEGEFGEQGVTDVFESPREVFSYLQSITQVETDDTLMVVYYPADMHDILVKYIRMANECDWATQFIVHYSSGENEILDRA